MKNITKILTASAVCASLTLAIASCRPATAPESTTEVTTTTATAAETTTEDTTAGTSETTTESSEETTGPAGNGPDETSESSAASPAKITVSFSDDVTVDKDNSDHVSISTTEPITEVVFSTDVEVKEFKILNLEITDYDEEKGVLYKYETAFIQEALVPGRALVADLTFAGDIPTLGFSYVDTDGSLKTFSIGLSGEDESIVVSEI